VQLERAAGWAKRMEGAGRPVGAPPVAAWLSQLAWAVAAQQEVVVG
jgi:hypothetical protein